MLVGDLGDVAQRAHVVHRRLELAERDAGERRVLAVRGEQPRVVGPAGADEPHALDGADRGRVLLALLDEPELQVLGRLRGVGEVLLAPVDALLQAPVAGQRELRPRAGLLARRGLALERAWPGRRPRRPAARGRRPGPCPSPPPRSTRSPSRARGRGRRSAAGRRCPCRTGRRRRRSAGACPRARPPRAGCTRRPPGRRGGPGRSRPTPPRGRSRPARRSRGRGRPGGRSRRRPCRAGCRRLARRRPPPRVGAHQLGVGVDLDLGRAGGAARVAQLEPEQHGAAAVHREVRAAQLEAVGVGQVHAGVAPAAGEVGAWPTHWSLDAEPDAVGELQRRRPDAAHLAGDVPAVRVPAAVLEPGRVGALARDEVAAVLQAVGDGSLR